MTGLQDMLDPQAICLQVEVADAAAAIGLLAERLHALGRVKGSYRDAVTERERTMPTGLPLGAVNVAVPHTDPVHVINPSLALATLRSPVLFGSMDDPDEMIPVQVVMAMALTDKNAQIDMLQRIASFIQNPAALAALVAAETLLQAQAALSQMAQD
ncbi:PTS sugar transporter subunit IIA [Lichenifustis flavocetrariae]|uniref:PTS sugar transporter subunit IIA n=1 Tax=Lichenifustis flavocetrariae TaxID=2949735 RepID=A0AA42CJY0_9HYPH|nr:PTS sugar transporter subunit IIA [Lichenifustis flavocetrariae]MCW6509979.1 PTS sugar transporter subunit IIA [Lichenifustis flavocetrariae]